MVSFMGEVFFKSSEGCGKRPSLPDEQLSLATAGRLRRDCIYIELGHQLDRVLGIQATQTDQQTAVWHPWFKGESLDSYKSQTDTPASVRGLSSCHQMKMLYVFVILIPTVNQLCLYSPAEGYFKPSAFCDENDSLWYWRWIHTANNLSHIVLADVMRQHQNYNKQNVLRGLPQRPAMTGSAIAKRKTSVKWLCRYIIKILLRWGKKKNSGWYCISFEFYLYFQMLPHAVAAKEKRFCTPFCSHLFWKNIWLHSWTLSFHFNM